jgi:hypothetical protein
VSWVPNPTVTVGTAVYTGRTVGEVTTVRGRNTVYSRTQPAYANLELIDVTDGGLGFDVGVPLQVTIENTAGSAVPIFTGFVSDWESDVRSRGPEVEPVVRYRVTAVGPLARLNRRTVLFGGRPEEKDGVRVAAAVGEALPLSWEEYSFDQQWSQAGSVMWDTVDPGFDPTLFDGGVYDLVALGTADAGYNALQVAQEAGESAKGLLFETADGFIGYADGDRRPANAAAGFQVIPYASLAADRFSLSSNFADIINDVTVEYGAGEAVTERDLFSVTRFGVQASQVRTALANLSDAEARADDILFSNALPRVELERLVVNLRSDIDGGLRDFLVSVDPSDAVRVSGVPVKVLSGGFRGFVEGVSFRVSDFEATVDLLVSDESLSFGSVLWGQVDATIAFEDVNAALTWGDARRVTV